MVLCRERSQGRQRDHMVVWGLIQEPPQGAGIQGGDEGGSERNNTPASADGFREILQHTHTHMQKDRPIRVKICKYRDINTRRESRDMIREISARDGARASRGEGVCQRSSRRRGPHSQRSSRRGPHQTSRRQHQSPVFYLVVEAPVRCQLSLLDSTYSWCVRKIRVPNGTAL